jgi:DNA polymerase-1
MLELFKQGEDIHTMTASDVFDIPKEKVGKPERDLAKTLNFGVLYGMGQAMFAQRTGLGRDRAKDFIKRYFLEFQGIAEYVQKAKAMARDQGFVQTMFGRKRFLAEIDSLDPRLRAQAERMAVNMPFQGTAADIIKMAMVEMNEQGLLNNDCRLLLQIHDELLFEIDEKQVKKIAPVIKQIMEGVARLEAPLKADLKIGRSWGALGGL